MKELEFTNNDQLEIGELYLFHQLDKSCPNDCSLWGFYDKTENGVITLEHCTNDLTHFHSWYKLPKEYIFCRLATRSELRDYMFNLGYAEASKE